eukprot:COSAG01_NODE_151_length_23939_cov_24.482802_12_plen_736_part_00
MVPVRLADRGFAAIHKAAWTGDAGAISSLLAQGAAVNRLDKQRNTPLHVACERGWAGVVTSLLHDGGGSAQMLNRQKRSALHVAAESGHANCVRVLLAHADLDTTARRLRVDSSARDSAGQSAADLAQQGGFVRMAAGIRGELWTEDDGSAVDSSEEEHTSAAESFGEDSESFTGDLVREGDTDDDRTAVKDHYATASPRGMNLVQHEEEQEQEATARAEAMSSSADVAQRTGSQSLAQGLAVLQRARTALSDAALEAGEQASSPPLPLHGLEAVVRAALALDDNELASAVATLQEELVRRKFRGGDELTRDSTSAGRGVSPREETTDRYLGDYSGMPEGQEKRRDSDTAMAAAAFVAAANRDFEELPSSRYARGRATKTSKSSTLASSSPRRDHARSPRRDADDGRQQDGWSPPSGSRMSNSEFFAQLEDRSPRSQSPGWDHRPRYAPDPSSQRAFLAQIEERGRGHMAGGGDGELVGAGWYYYAQNSGRGRDSGYYWHEVTGDTRGQLPHDAMAEVVRMIDDAIGCGDSRRCALVLKRVAATRNENAFMPSLRSLQNYADGLTDEALRRKRSRGNGIGVSRARGGTAAASSHPVDSAGGLGGSKPSGKSGGSGGAPSSMAKAARRGPTPRRSSAPDGDARVSHPSTSASASGLRGQSESEPQPEPEPQPAAAVGRQMRQPVASAPSTSSTRGVAARQRYGGSKRLQQQMEKLRRAKEQQAMDAGTGSGSSSMI